MVHSIKIFSVDRLGKHLTYCGKRIEMSDNSSAVVGEITCDTCRKTVAETKIKDLKRKVGSINEVLAKLDKNCKSFGRLSDEKDNHKEEINRLTNLI